MASNLRIVTREFDLPDIEPDAARAIALSPTGALALLGRHAPTVSVFDLRGLRRISQFHILPERRDQPNSPVAFAGENSRYLLANYTGEHDLIALWVSDLETGRLFQLGEAALRLTRARDGSVWGTFGLADPAGPPQPGVLFRYIGGDDQVTIFPSAGLVSLFTEAPGRPGCLVLLSSDRIILYDYERQVERSSMPLLSMPLAAALDEGRGVVWYPFAGGSMLGCLVDGSDNLAAVILGDRFQRPDRGFFCLPESGWVAGVSGDGMVCVFDPFTQRVLLVPGASPAGAVAVAPDEDAWYSASRRLTKYALVAGLGGREAAFRQGQIEDQVGALRLTLNHEAMRIMLRLADDPGSWAECLIPETVDARFPDDVDRPPRLNWDRVMSGIYWERAASGWWEMCEEHEDIAYLCRLRLHPNGQRLEVELTVFNRGQRDWQSCRLSPCVGLAGDMLDMPHRRTFVPAGDGRLTPLGQLVGEFPYVAVSVRGAHAYPANPLRPKAFHFVDLQLPQAVIIVRANHGRHALVTSFEQAEALSALFVPCIHNEVCVTHVPAGGQTTVRGFVAWVRGDEQAAYAEYLAWRESL